MSCRRTILCLFLFLSLLPAPPRAQEKSSTPPAPFKIGVDMAGSYHLNKPVQKAYWDIEAYFDAVHELGATFVGVHLFPFKTGHWFESVWETPESMLAKILGIDRAMRAHGLQYQLNDDISQYYDQAPIFPGVDEFDAPEGCHRWDLRAEWFGPLVAANNTSGTAFLGWVHDETAHMQLDSNHFVNWPEENHPNPVLNEYDVPRHANVHGLPMEAAWVTLVESCAWIVEEHYGNQVPVFDEEVIPDMFHIFAHAGWTLSPKLMKESFSSMIMANAMGAALQYADRSHIWVVGDMHGWVGYPGHSPQALRSSMLMSYWLGADAFSVENLDWKYADTRHPLAEPGGSLIRWVDDTHYELTVHGRVFRDFAKSYVLIREHSPC